MAAQIISLTRAPAATQPSEEPAARRRGSCHAAERGRAQLRFPLEDFGALRRALRSTGDVLNHCDDIADEASKGHVEPDLAREMIRGLLGMLNERINPQLAPAS